MTIIQSFNLTHLDEVLRNNLSISKLGKLEYYVEQFDNSVVFLNVISEGVHEKYVLVKVLDNYQLGNKDQFLLKPTFLIDNDHGEIYGGFNKTKLDNYNIPKENCLQQLKMILKSLASYQASVLVNRKDDKSEYDVKLLTDSVIGLEYFTNIEPKNIELALKTLQTGIDNVLKSNLFVNSIISPLANNIYIGHNCLFLDAVPGHLFPPVYDALLCIFMFTSEQFRQKHFDELITFYFNCLENKIKNITKIYQEVQVHNLTPLVKFQLVKNLEQSSPIYQEILTNLKNYIQCPLLNQEDVYATIKNILNSNEYELIKFQLVPLSEKNGHLGEYFYLKIDLLYQNQQKHIQVFAKFILAATEMLKEIIENGVAKKEDFFYSTLYPLFRENVPQNLLDFAPKCYLSRVSGILILEDLGLQGYISLKPNNVFNVDGLKVFLDKLAKFHSCTIITEENLSKSGKTVRLDNVFSEYLEETILKLGGNLEEWYEGSVELLYYIINKFSGLAKKFSNYPKAEVLAKLKKIIFTPFDKVKTSKKMRNIVAHGDMYIGNVLVKFGKDKIVQSGILIDFQILRYIPPAYEILFFIFINSSKETRNQHLKTLLYTYYDKLCGYLTSANLDPETTYSKADFERDVNFAKSAALATAFNYAFLIHADADFREEILHEEEKMKYYLQDNKEEFVDLCWQNEHYRNIMRGFVEDFLDVFKNESI